MNKGPRFDALLGIALLVVPAALFAVGCGEERPGAGSQDAAPVSVEKRPAPRTKVESTPRTRDVKAQVNQTMDEEAAKRARQMDQIFR